MGIAVQAREMSLKIPQDLGLIGFGNHLSSSIMDPQLTSIYQSETEIADISFLLLDQMINKELPIGEECTKMVKAEIVYRESC
jgi:DNA-binding LacI/PurR family transcriptional regulator